MITKRKNKITLLCGLTLIIAFIIWTLLLCFIDRDNIGPNNSTVGFATLNEYVHELTGTNMTLYALTDWLGIIPIAVAFSFALLGLVQLIKRKSLLKVDGNILFLGAFYVLVILIYLLFENIVINYRPVLIGGYLEVSYPSSTTMLTMCVMPTSLMQLNCRVSNQALKRFITVSIFLFTAFMVVGRIISGVHWITDIIGGAFISAGLVLTYHSLVKFK